MLRVVYKWHRLCVRGARADACAQHNDACASQHDIRCGAEHDAGHNGERADNEHNDACASQHDTRSGTEHDTGHHDRRADNECGAGAVRIIVHCDVRAFSASCFRLAALP